MLTAGGRRQRLAGFLKDAEKYEAAMCLGWRVYRVPGPWVATRKRHIWREQVMTTPENAVAGGPVRPQMGRCLATTYEGHVVGSHL